MKMLSWPVLIVCLGWCVGQGSTAAVPNTQLIVDIDSPFCQGDSTLTCDFQDNDKEVLLAADLGRLNQTTLVKLHRISSLTLDRGVCRDLRLEDVVEVRTEGEAPWECPTMTLHLRNVKMDFLGAPVTSLDAYDSQVQRLEMETALDRLVVVGSTIDSFNVKQVIDTDVTVKLLRTNVAKLDHLHVAGRSRLLFQHVNIQHMEGRALVLKSKRNELIEMTFPPLLSDNSAAVEFGLECGADVTLKEIRGSVRITGPACPKVQTPSPEDTAQPIVNGNEGPDALFITILVIMCFSMAFNFVCVAYICWLKLQPAHTGDLLPAGHPNTNVSIDVAQDDKKNKLDRRRLNSYNGPYSDSDLKF